MEKKIIVGIVQTDSALLYSLDELLIRAKEILYLFVSISVIYLEDLEV